MLFAPVLPPALSQVHYLSLDATPTAEGLTGTSGKANEIKVSHASRLLRMGSKHTVYTLASEASARKSKASSVKQHCLSELCDMGTTEPSCSMESSLPEATVTRC